VTDYLRGTPYDDLPVVGVSYNQAVNYSKWRSDRVMEMILIERGIMMPNQFGKDYENFSILKYYTKDINKLPKEEQVWTYPQFDLPTIEEWKSINIFNNELIKVSDCEEKDFIISKENFDLNSGFSKEKTKKCKINTKKALQNIKGNICEWIEGGKMCGGGSYLQSLEHIQKSLFFSVKEQKTWVGFRNVSRMKKWETSK
jgi:hypothetical protein